MGRVMEMHYTVVIVTMVTVYVAEETNYILWM